MNGSKEKTQKIVIIAFLTAFNIALNIITGKITGLGENVMVGSIELNTTQIAGVLTAIRTLIMVGAVLTDRVIGFWASAVAWVISFISMFGVFLMGSYDSVPGLATAITQIVLVYIMVAFMKKQERHHMVLKQISAEDSLTRLLNRRAFADILDELICKNVRFTLCSINILNYQNVVNTLGNDYGDQMILEGAHRLKAVAEESEILGRIGGAELAVLIRNPGNPAEDGVKLARYVEKLRSKTRIGNAELEMEVKGAVVRFPEDGKDRSELFRHLVATHTFGKTDSVRSIEFYSEFVLNEMSRENHVEDRLMDALDRNLFHLVFQPQFYTTTKKLRGFETLIRLEEEDGTPISPAEFIPIAEKKNLIFKIDDLVLETALGLFAPQIRLHPDLMLSVNVSAKHFSKPGFSDQVCRMVTSLGFPPSNFEIEVTETAFAENIEDVKKCLAALRDFGIRIAMDDFGTGYASLSYLSQLPISLLKVDKAFVDKLGKNVTDDEFANLIISLGHILGIEVLSEGVESPTQVEKLKEWNCDIIQGFVWGKPMDFAKAGDLIEVMSA